MSPPRRILLPIDFSKAASTVAPYAREMAQRFGATVTVLHAFNLAPDDLLAPRFKATSETGLAPIPYTAALLELRDQRQRWLEDFARDQFANVGHEVRLEDGIPADVIERIVERESVDLITMPTKGQGKFRRLLFGSVAAKVLHDVRCPVFTTAHEPEVALNPLDGYRSILCAVEINQEAEAVLRAATFLALCYGARICLVHVESRLSQDGEAQGLQRLQQMLQKIFEVESAGSRIETKLRIRESTVPEGIRCTAREEHADLIVVGRGHEKGGLSRVWSHLYTIIRESPCPVLSV